ncbi:MAG: helix-turn-helix domain-containing protein [Methylococcaceae bacterium]|nr:helix-turn-helix domain-containing protein [Methylococcaceae bacterium]
MNDLHNQIKKLRKELGFKQEDIATHIGMARQQYQKLESRGNPRLDTLELIAKGLKMELMLIPPPVSG